MTIEIRNNSILKRLLLKFIWKCNVLGGKGKHMDISYPSWKDELEGPDAWRAETRTPPWWESWAPTHHSCIPFIHVFPTRMTQTKPPGGLARNQGLVSTSVCFQSLSVFGVFPQVLHVLPQLRVDPDSWARCYNWSFYAVKTEWSVILSPSNRLLS